MITHATSTHTHSYMMATSGLWGIHQFW